MNVETKPLIYIRYKDHVLFHKAEANLYKPVVREAVGWLVRENDEAIWILWDKSVETLAHERTCAESGLVILKNNIIQIKEIGHVEASIF